MAKATMTGGQFIDQVATDNECKRGVVRNILLAVSALAAKQLKSTGVVRIPYVCKIVVKKSPARKHKAGNYTNPFTKETTFRKAWTTPARTKLKAYAVSQVKNEVIR